MELGNIRFESIEYKEENPWLTFPIINRVFARTLASDIVTVQAISAPTGLLNHAMPVHDRRMTFKIDVGDLTKQEIEEYINSLRNSLRDEYTTIPTFETLSLPKVNRTFS